MNLRLFVIEQAHEFVVLFDGFERLDENGLPAGTSAVNHALHAALLLDLDGNDEALAADGDQLILHRAAFGQTPQVCAKGILNPTALLFDLAANPRQFSRSMVFQRAIGLNLVAKISQEL